MAKLKDVLKACAVLDGHCGKDLAEQIEAWAALQPDTSAQLLALKPKGKASADAVIACAMAYPALGLVLNWDCVTHAASLLSMDKAALQQCFASAIAPFIMQRDAANLMFGWTFKSAGTAQLKDNCRKAQAELPALITLALKDLTIALARGMATEQYLKFFGEYDAGRASTVKKVLQDILYASTSSTLWLYYRGKSVAKNTAVSDWPFGQETGVEPGDYAGMTVVSQGQLLFAKKSNAMQAHLGKSVHIKIGKHREDGDVAHLRHVLIHEMTHYTSNTQDVVVTINMFLAANAQADRMIKGGNKKLPTFRPDGSLAAVIEMEDYLQDQRRHAVQKVYDEKMCLALAEASAKRAVMNADNYAFYCGAFAP